MNEQNAKLIADARGFLNIIEDPSMTHTIVTQLIDALAAAEAEIAQLKAKSKEWKAEFESEKRAHRANLNEWNREATEKDAEVARLKAVAEAAKEYRNESLPDDNDAAFAARNRLDAALSEDDGK